MDNSGLSTRAVRKISLDGEIEFEDILAVEEPLEIRVTYGREGSRTTQSVSVTMRTPTHDKELAAGFLFTEGIVKSNEDILEIRTLSNNEVVVDLHESLAPDLSSLERRSYTSSSCGVCGKNSIESLATRSPFEKVINKLELPADTLYQLPGKLRNQQSIFERTGGLHASALFDLEGRLVLLREDVGRHNALDKLIGASLLADKLPLSDRILLLSGRISFELVQKAVMAGITFIAAVGAPSSLALDLAIEQGVTLIGFLREGRFNIYSGRERVLMPLAK